MDLYMRLDLMNPNSPFHYVLNNGVPSDTSVSSPGPDGRVGGHPRIPATNSFLNPTTSGGSLFSPTSTDFDFGGSGGGGVGSVSGWPIPPFASPSSTAATNTSVAFSDQHLHHPLNHQPPRLRSESTSAVLSALMSTPRGEEKTTAPSRFDVNGEVDLEAASSSLSTTEFLSKLRSQLAMSAAAAAANGQLPPSLPNQPAPISPPSRDISGGGGGGVGGIATLSVGGGEDATEGSPPPVTISPLSGGQSESTVDGEQVVVGSSGGGEVGVEVPEKGGGR